ncbi:MULTISPECIES: rhamnogalacturonan acetylesterase [Prevotellaceae]|uniref:Rhamnogalacturonan acetylesterase n=2 Tax=Xylanibacter rodentium TaxID=2736289 RepID=A0ABX2ATR3_9BACT|nr:rhamnogalacturonan acetylesterase [Xylanibacter rodentium]NPE10140.1 rhamnogalacturonan acetylesterase [Prevotella sp. PJ1A]NPE12797.1 rhamnogalacturonan acetylesterase [Xylanibacter rodentium]NPE38416.1 rhamnogalacturonan acetylesterase [Prevotella sp. PCJ2]
MKRIKVLGYMAVVLMVLSAFKQDKVVTIFMIGDSTMANKSIKNGNKERGWGMALQCYFDDGIRIDNHAVNGRSSKSFIDEGRWQVVVDKIRPGDYVFIQFGHNDEKPKADRHTDPGTTFDANLSKFVRETRDKGGIPVLFNSVVRRNFMKVAPKNDDDEALRKTTGPTTVKSNEEGDSLVDTHGDYIVAPRNVAKELGVVFVDANKITHELEQGMGREASRKLHMWFMPGEEPSIPKGRQDNTHYNIYGAHVVAGLLADAVSEEIPALKKHLVHRDMSVASNGIGDFFTVQEAVDNAVDGKKTTIQLFAGEWDRPTVSKGKKIKFVLREGAKWKK